MGSSPHVHLFGCTHRAELFTFWKYHSPPVLFSSEPPSYSFPLVETTDFIGGPMEIAFDKDCRKAKLILSQSALWLLAWVTKCFMAFWLRHKLLCGVSISHKVLCKVQICEDLVVCKKFCNTLKNFNEASSFQSEMSSKSPQSALWLNMNDHKALYVSNIMQQSALWSCVHVIKLCTYIDCDRNSLYTYSR